MKLRIESDGTAGGTQITNVDTGEVIEWVTEVSWEISTTDFKNPTAKVRMAVDGVTADVTGELAET